MPAKRNASPKDTSSATLGCGASRRGGFQPPWWSAADGERYLLETSSGFGCCKSPATATTTRPTVMKLALLGFDAGFGPKLADTFRRNLHPDLRADYVLANPPSNDSDRFSKDDDVRWQPSGSKQISKGTPKGERGGVHQFDVPPKGNASFACAQDFIHHHAPHGMADFVLTNDRMSSNQSREGDIRRAPIDADLVGCMVALLSQLFYSTQIPVCLWFLAKNKTGTGGLPVSLSKPVKAGRAPLSGLRTRKGETLFMDGRKLGILIDRVQREFTDAYFQRITTSYRSSRETETTLLRQPRRFRQIRHHHRVLSQEGNRKLQWNKPR